MAKVELSKEEKRRITKERGCQFVNVWRKMTAKEKYEALVRIPPADISESIQAEPKQPSPISAEKKPQALSEPGAKQVNVSVEPVADKQRLDVPVEAAVEKQQVDVPVQLVAKESPIERIPTTINNINYYFDNSIRYYPRVGGDESGPRIEPRVVM